MLRSARGDPAPGARRQQGARQRLRLLAPGTPPSPSALRTPPYCCSVLPNHHRNTKISISNIKSDVKSCISYKIKYNFIGNILQVINNLYFENIIYKQPIVYNSTL